MGTFIPMLVFLVALSVLVFKLGFEAGYDEGWADHAAGKVHRNDR